MSNIVIETLMKEYWVLLKQENYPNTPTTTQKIDALEVEIGKLKQATKGK
jgi:hypothetical protein